ncbi:YesL family protein [Microbacterium jejuense]|uniref:YesL family protein n=1 Tax=Microbacterium jejuense TaxID=1263637 RepID=UPI0031E68B5D
MTDSAAPVATWALRAHAVFDWIWWIALLNLLWWAFALVGLIVVGAVPASVAAADLTRRRLRGEVFPVVRAFAAAWRRELWRSNAALGVGAVVTAILAVNVVGRLGAGAIGEPLGIVSAMALVAAFTITAVAVPMYAHYDLPLRAYLLTAGRWAARNVLHVVLLLLGAVAVAGVGSVLPGAVPFFTVGAWLTLSTVLCIAFFTANDRALAEREAAASTSR